ncbi:hypothetical protein NESM_000440500 [Novymonas esmeraldas]|uniref:Uncharacterized protein n=1 Tax=Novymonas esmeraldas TaxID=1808958 RepID=A0AAW0EPG3_9TRYP
MQSTFTNVETELRDIEEAFATGRMNAFGSAATQDAFVHELKRIAEIETQVFYRTCALLKSSSTNEHTLVTNMYASAQPPPQSQRSGPAAMSASGNVGDGSFRVGSSSGMDGSMYRGASMGQRTHSPFPSTLAGSRGGMVPPTNGSSHSPGTSRPQSSSHATASNPFSAAAGDATGAAPHIRHSEWGNEDGFADKAFEDVAAHFDELESQFFSLGDYLRDISKHVMRLNDMSEQVNSGATHPINPAAAANGNDSSVTTGMSQTLGVAGRQDRVGSFGDAFGGADTHRFDGPA